MLRHAFHCCLACAALAVGGCTQFPDLEHTQDAATARADYPALIPIEPLLARAEAPGPDPAESQAQIDARLAGLRARADRLRGSIMTEAEKQRLRTGLR